LPSVHEWHKAAYYDPPARRCWAYPTGSNEVPDGVDFPGDPAFAAASRDPASNGEPNAIDDVGIGSPFGTAGQGGSVDERLETAGEYVNQGAHGSKRVHEGNWGNAANVLLRQHFMAIGPSFEGASSPSALPAPLPNRAFRPERLPCCWLAPVPVGGASPPAGWSEPRRQGVSAVRHVFRTIDPCAVNEPPLALRLRLFPPCGAAAPVHWRRQDQ